MLRNFSDVSSVTKRPLKVFALATDARVRSGGIASSTHDLLQGLIAMLEIGLIEVLPRLAIDLGLRNTTRHPPIEGHQFRGLTKRQATFWQKDARKPLFVTPLALT